MKKDNRPSIGRSYSGICILLTITLLFCCAGCAEKPIEADSQTEPASGTEVQTEHQTEPVSGTEVQTEPPIAQTETTEVSTEKTLADVLLGLKLNQVSLGQDWKDVAALYGTPTPPRSIPFLVVAPVDPEAYSRVQYIRQILSWGEGESFPNLQEVKNNHLSFDEVCEKYDFLEVCKQYDFLVVAFQAGMGTEPTRRWGFDNGYWLVDAIAVTKTPASGLPLGLSIGDSRDKVVDAIEADPLFCKHLMPFYTHQYALWDDFALPLLPTVDRTSHTRHRGDKLITPEQARSMTESISISDGNFSLDFLMENNVLCMVVLRSPFPITAELLRSYLS